MADKETNKPADNESDKGAAYQNLDAGVSHKSGTGSDLASDNRFVWKDGEVRFFDKDGRPVVLSAS